MKVKSGELAQRSKPETQDNQQSAVLTKLSAVLSRVKRLGNAVVKRPALVASLTVTGLLFLGRQTELLQPLELSAFDRLMQLRPALPPDPRLLVVTITEADIQSQEKWPLTDAVMYQLLTRLEQYQPTVIGLDIYRDFAQPPGHEQLSALLQSNERIIPVCKRTNAEDPGVPPPPGISDSRVGFSDIAIDPNGIVRRALLFVNPFSAASNRCPTAYSFSFQLARRYLEQKGIEPELTPQEFLKMGDVVFKPLTPNDGGYQDADAGGYQILLNYRSPNSPAQRVTLSDILNNRIDPSLVKDRIVLIGVTAPSIDDAFYTPYSSAQRRLSKMPGVEIHGQIVSQLLSAVLNGRQSFWFWPEWGEIAWIWVWSLTGGILVRVARQPGKLILTEGIALGVLLGSSILLFFGGAWVPVVAPVLGLLVSSTGVLGYNAYESERLRLQAEQERQYIEDKAKEQEQNIALLQTLLKERSNQSSALNTVTLPAEDTGMIPEEATVPWTPQDAPLISTAAEEPNKTSANLLAGRYRTRRILGSGGFGLTYLAEDTLRPGNPLCVVKHLRPARQDEKFLLVARRLFNTEAEILEKLGIHPHIPQLLAYFEENKEFYLVQEYIEGHALSEELPIDKRLPEAQVVELLKQVLEILIFIHKHSVIHRDIKPSNIMRRDNGQVVLIDFGAVKQLQPQEQIDQENPTIAIGTRGYAPPESYAGHPSFSSDIYSLGMIGVQAVTGIPPHQLPISPETGDVSWRYLANVSEEFAQVLEKMVRYHFAIRYQSATQVMEELEKL